ncbi:MAG: hypothetical protein ACK46A_04950 [Akkermansiaceae bacterium]|jgi:hypothetical protein|nr:hypothetical protein [Luteolibacter sp.]
MAKKDQNPEKVDSLSNYKQAMSLNAKLFRVLILVVCFGFITVIYMMLKPQNLSDIDGYKSASAPPRNVQEVLSKAIEGNYSVTITEADINQMFASQLVAKQGGAFSSDASIKHVLVRLKKDIAEMIIVRKVFGQEITVSMYLQIEQTESESGISTKVHLHGSNIHKGSGPKVGGRFGKLRVPQGFLMAVVDDYAKIADVLAPEIKLGFEEMARFEIQEDRLVLDPRAPTRHEGGSANPF